LKLDVSDPERSGHQPGRRQALRLDFQALGSPEVARKLEGELPLMRGEIQRR
jgi:hypothetical protein